MSLLARVDLLLAVGAEEMGLLVHLETCCWTLKKGNLQYGQLPWLLFLLGGMVILQVLLLTEKEMVYPLKSKLEK